MPQAYSLMWEEVVTSILTSTSSDKEPTGMASGAGLDGQHGLLTACLLCPAEDSSPEGRAPYP